MFFISDFSINCKNVVVNDFFEKEVWFLVFGSDLELVLECMDVDFVFSFELERNIIIMVLGSIGGEKDGFRNSIGFGF